jgi:hypothetical protein
MGFPWNSSPWRSKALFFQVFPQIIRFKELAQVVRSIKFRAFDADIDFPALSHAKAIHLD